MGKNITTFGTDRSSSVHIDNKNEDILILGEGTTQALNNTKLTAEVKYLIDFTESGKDCVKSALNGSNSFLFVNATKLYQFKAKDSEIKPYVLCFSNILKDLTIGNKTKARLKGSVKVFLLIIMLLIIANIYRYLIKET